MKQDRQSIAGEQSLLVAQAKDNDLLRLLVATNESITYPNDNPAWNIVRPESCCYCLALWQKGYYIDERVPL